MRKKKIRWVVQNNLTAENDFNIIKKCCEVLDVEFKGVKVIPFSPKLPRFRNDHKTNLYYGSTTFIDNLYKQKNAPIGVFFNENFSMEKYLQVWGKYMLSSEAQITTFGKFTNPIISGTMDPDGDWFIRPDADDKSFNGQVMTYKEITEWQTRFTSTEKCPITNDTKILVGPAYNIEKEWRNYVVDGKVVTSSLYRKDFVLNKSRENIPEEMIKFVEDRCKEFQPHKLFAMDIALCGGDYYIIECGCLNSVGLYACDVPKLIRSITEYFQVRL